MLPALKRFYGLRAIRRSGRSYIEVIFGIAEMPARKAKARRKARAKTKKAAKRPARKAVKEPAEPKPEATPEEKPAGEAAPA
jgi:hypothetical protein